MPTIALEEHFLTQTFLDTIRKNGHQVPAPLQRMLPSLLDLGAGRVAAMDAGAIDLQVLSLASQGFDDLDSAVATPLARDVNDELAAAVRAHPGRFAGFAVLNLKDPAGAARELDRSVSQLGFVGAMLDGTTKFPAPSSANRFLDDPVFTPVWEAAAHLGVPIYLHPAPPPQPVLDAYFTGLPPQTPQDIGFLLSIAGWGWHSEVALHTLRLVVSGLFDRLPALQLIIGHMGEMLPIALARSSAVLSRAATSLKRPVAEYFQSNIHITTSGYFTQPPLRCAMEVIGLERIMFSVDYPFSPNEHGRSFLDEAAKHLSPAGMERLSHANAAALLRLEKTIRQA